ncbi:haloacid dehalogenase-like hydrolase [Lapillicoccus sp.]|uniref:haloacid dehalogenase-like hydrolase n=1 Tax=Lapillicoccus sp. TaxID=1909287 RepID=UPI0025FE73ED|nr:haloacid dehalogenase-like hydrolase [Lapillicoccus sp.]
MGARERWEVGELAAGLPSWRPGPTRDWLCRMLLASVDLPPLDRVAAFDNDGTLACEKPAPSVHAYLTHLVSDAHPADGHDTERLLAAALAGLTPSQAAAKAEDFLARACHPRFHLSYPQIIYRPMRELVQLLHRLDFTVYLVSDGSRDFLRVMASSAYGIRPEHVIGTEAVISWPTGRCMTWPMRGRRGSRRCVPDVYPGRHRHDTCGDKKRPIPL